MLYGIFKMHVYGTSPMQQQRPIDRSTRRMRLLALRACIVVQHNFEEDRSTRRMHLLALRACIVVQHNFEQNNDAGRGRERHVNRSQLKLKDALACAACLYCRATVALFLIYQQKTT